MNLRFVSCHLVECGGNVEKQYGCLPIHDAHCRRFLEINSAMMAGSPVSFRIRSINSRSNRFFGLFDK